MRKLTSGDKAAIVKILRAWKGRRLTWKALEREISNSLWNGEASWTSEALRGHDAILAAWRAGKARLRRRGPRSPVSEDSLQAGVERLETELQELQIKYDNLALRHRQLLYNAALLPGGMKLLSDPLPDNTRSQSGGGTKANQRK